MLFGIDLREIKHLTNNSLVTRDLKQSYAIKIVGKEFIYY